MELPEGQHRIPEARWADFEAKFEKLARRARKLGVGQVSYAIVKLEKRQVIRETRRTLSISGERLDTLDPREREIGEADVIPDGWALIGYSSYHIVTVEGDRPRLNGWRFIGTLQALKDDEGHIINILRNAPGESIPAKYRDAEQWCDQCHTRRYRIDTYIVQHEDGRTAQVGSDCLKDFLGHASPETIARFCEYLIELDALAGSSEYSGSGGGPQALYLPYILTLTAARVRVKGWMSRRKAREIAAEAATYDEKVDRGEATGHLKMVEATADAVNDYLDKDKGPHEMLRDGVEITDADKAEAEAALEWIRSHDRVKLQSGSDNDYLYNLYAACARDDMSLRTLGIVASLIAAYQREMGRQAERKERNAKFANSQFIGTLKKREVFALKLTAEPIHYANDFGGSYLYRLEDPAGNQVTWWAGNTLHVESGEFEDRGVWSRETQTVTTIRVPVTRPWAVGETLNVKATPVKHEERNGIKTTTVNRVALDVPKGKAKA